MAQQPTLRELTMSCPVLERYARHQYVEGFMKNGANIKRNYTWAPAEDYTRIKVRCVTAKVKPWIPVVIPNQGAVIRFSLDAHLREWVDQHTEREHRKSNT